MHVHLDVHCAGILRIIYAFYMGLSRAEAPYVSVPLNCVLQLVPSAFSCEEKVSEFLNLLWQVYLQSVVCYMSLHGILCHYFLWRLRC